MAVEILLPVVAVFGPELLRSFAFLYDGLCFYSRGVLMTPGDDGILGEISFQAMTEKGVSEVTIRVPSEPEGEDQGLQQVMGLLEKMAKHNIQPYADLAILYCEYRQFEKADRVISWAVSLMENELGPESAELLPVLRIQSLNAGKWGRADIMEETSHRMIQILSDTPGIEEQHRIISVYNSLGFFYKNHNRDDDAEQAWKDALIWRVRLFGESHPESVVELNNLATLYFSQRKYQAAESLYLRALSLEGPADQVTNAVTWHNLGVMYMEDSRLNEAERAIKNSVDCYKQTVGDAHPDLAETLVCLVRLYQAMNRRNEAEEVGQQALTIQKEYYGEDSTVVQETEAYLASL